MSPNHSTECGWGDRWDQLYEALSAEPRRMLITSLLDVPRERRLSLPEAAESPNQSIDSEALSIQLRHHHLPKLAELGYVRWERDPFCARRGPRFEEAAFIMEKVLDSVDEIPRRLIDNCRVLMERRRDRN